MKRKLISALLLLALLCSTLLVACNKEDGSSAGSVGLEYKASDDGESCTVTGIGTCTDTEIKIPETIDGLKVVAIGGAAFSKNDKLTSVIIPFGVKTITANAFLDCPNLSYVSLPATLEKIGPAAFRGCDLLKTVYYEGEPSDWRGVNLGEQNEAIESASMYYFSEYSPTSSGSYWHYVDGVPTKW